MYACMRECMHTCPGDLEGHVVLKCSWSGETQMSESGGEEVVAKNGQGVEIENLEMVCLTVKTESRYARGGRWWRWGGESGHWS